MSDPVNTAKLEHVSVAPCSGSGYVLEVRYRRASDDKTFYRQHAVEDVKSLKETVAALVLSPILSL